MYYQSAALILLIYVGVGFVSSSPVEAKEETRSVEQCGGQPLKPEKMKAANATCVAEFKISEKTSVKEFEAILESGCYHACFLEKLGIVTSTGAPNPTGITEFIRATYPSSFEKKLVEGITTCAEKLSSTLSKKDGDCTSYEPLFMCIGAFVDKNCGPDSGSRRRRQVSNPPPRTSPHPFADMID